MKDIIPASEGGFFGRGGQYLLSNEEWLRGKMCHGDGANRSSKRQYMDTDIAGINSYQSAFFNVGGKLDKGIDDQFENIFRPDIGATDLRNTGRGGAGKGQNSSKVKVIGKNGIPFALRIVHDLIVRGVAGTDFGPVNRLNTLVCQHSRPTMRHIHINNEFQRPLRLDKGRRMTPGKPCGKLEGLHNVFTLNVGIIGQQFFNGLSRADLGYYPSNGNPCSTDTGFAPHHGGIQANPIQI